MYVLQNRRFTGVSYCTQPTHRHSESRCFVEQTINRLSHHTNQPQTIDSRCLEEYTFLQIIPLHTTNPQSYVKRFFAEQTFYKTKQSKRPPFSSLHQLAFYIHPSTNPPNLTHTQPITPIIYSHPTQPIPTHITS